MIAKVIQGSFLGGQAKLATLGPRRVMPPPIQTKGMVRPLGPPAPAFAGRPGAVQLHRTGSAFEVEAGQLGLASGGGKPLPAAMRNKMEAALNADFANVRVHIGPQAERIGAIAFTIGSDIYFAPGRYQPHTLQGQQLLGHELAHVVQQRAGRVRNRLSTGLAVVQDHSLEAEADRLGRSAAMHRVAAPAKTRPVLAQTSVPRDFRVVNLPGRIRIEALGQDRFGSIGAVELRRASSGAAELCNLRVAEPYRRRHLGSALVRKALNTASSNGAHSVVLEVRPGDGTIKVDTLISMYQKLGFRGSGRSATGNTVMQRAAAGQTTFSPGASPWQGPWPRIVQRAESTPAKWPETEAGKYTTMFSSHFGQIGEVEKISRKNPNGNEIKMYHMTSWKNLQSIRKTGLDPKLGGKPGGSVSITENKALKAESERTTLGKIAAATSNEVTAPYIHQKVAWAELVEGAPSANYEVLLRFSCVVGRPWAEDPVHHGAWHTKKLIPAAKIECLYDEGWMPILDINEEALRAIADYPPMAARVAAGKSNQGLAFTKAEFIAAFPQFKSLKWDDPGAVWGALKGYKGSTLYTVTAGECIFAGTTGHPIREPENWLYVCISTDEVSPKLADAQKRYREKILTPGWGLDTL